ncbi:uncharacterized protein N7469_002377 [Penicillium citrinum]|uniref:Rhodopsin domain-containing protein n=1 Tax=Penicillium citrinum TaxID=5077 RepID=A0A9W9TTG7_PENCI|nr:uncharacterized protein N7469_002377 [Penicillium citrinum]KAJ5240786.1 hypothetical protein N7469_002377 [Penicillium citrinum]
MQRNDVPAISLVESRVASVISCNTVCLVLATIGTCVRMIGTIYAHRFDVDDVTRYGYARHFVRLEADTETFTMLLKLDFVAAISYLISLLSIKVSFCLLYMKVFSITKLRWLYYLVLVIVSCQFIEELVCVTSIIRITYVRHFNTDFTWDLVPALNWSSVEVCVAIFIACVPAFRIVATRIFPILQTTFGLRSSHKSSQETDTLHISPLDQDYFTLKPAAKPISPRDCFPLPSPFVEEGNDLVTTMTGGLMPPGDTRIGHEHASAA